MSEVVRSTEKILRDFPDSKSYETPTIPDLGFDAVNIIQ